MNCSFTKSDIHNYLIQQGFSFYNNSISNPCLLFKKTYYTKPAEELLKITGIFNLLLLDDIL